MRTAALTFLGLVAFTCVVNAQRFSLLPQVGFENSRTSLSYNDAAYFSPLGVKFSPQASVRLSYSSRMGHGLFLGMATSRNQVAFSFLDPEAGMNDFTATAADMKLRFEGGYQFNSKKISLKNTRSSSRTQASRSTQSRGCGSYSKSSCKPSTYSASRCGSKSKTVSKQSWVRIQPSLGLGFMPSVSNGIASKMQSGQIKYEYTAGDWRTAILAGAGFEFGKGNARLFTVGLNYFRGLGNLDDVSMTTVNGSKTTTTTLSSKVSGWNLRVGIPFTLGKAASAKKSQVEKKKTECRQMQYKIQYRCRTTI
jgi:hypothetical protein